MTRRSFIAGCGAGLSAARTWGAAGEKEAFRLWFCWLAESLYYMETLPAEIRDCSSLLRFAYREALRPHTREWARQWGYSLLPPYPEPRFEGAALFSTEDGPRHFADARHLMRFNTRPVAKRLEAARPGDLLFYRSPDGTSWHAMAWLGPSRFEAFNEEYVIYHTGPEGGWRGEVRRPQVRELVAHPEPRWRPLPGNPWFLGVHRWNLLWGGV
jgi:hypothetical protein